MIDIIDSEKCFSSNIAPYRLRGGEFDVCQPYFRERKSMESENNNDDNTAPKSKKRKRNKEHVPSVTDVETQKRHEAIRSQLLACIEELPSQWPSHWKDLTVSSAAAATLDNVETETIDFPSIQQMVEAAQDKFSDKEEQEELPEFEFLSDVTKHLDIFSIFNIVCMNPSLSKVRLLQITPTSTYLIPPNSSFLMGSMNNSLQQLTAYINKLGGADIIVMDPPWPNKSAQRSSSYATQDIYSLFSIPIPKMVLSKDCLVVIWVTNKPKFRNFILSKLFPAWQLECVGEWLWLKTTTQGECIFPIDSNHKKPYEQLIIGRPAQHSEKASRVPIPVSHTLVSVPSVRHSRKPPLQGNESMARLSIYRRSKRPRLR
ncbi:MAG: MT-A70-domain-containing protein [Benjaminiella poitrasii]|nr:MAG: MT-A70-domain-containing protein [Benjaminiella poitrasii]